MCLSIYLSILASQPAVPPVLSVKSSWLFLENKNLPSIYQYIHLSMFYQTYHYIISIYISVYLSISPWTVGRGERGILKSEQLASAPLRLSQEILKYIEVSNKCLSFKILFPWHISQYLYIYLSVYIYLSKCQLLIYLCIIYASIYCHSSISIYISIFLSIYRSIFLSIYRSICPSIHLSIHLGGSWPAGAAGWYNQLSRGQEEAGPSLGIA